MRLVGGQGKHDQIGIQTVQNVALVGVESRLRTLIADETHNFVFTFSRLAGI